MRLRVFAHGTVSEQGTLGSGPAGGPPQRVARGGFSKKSAGRLRALLVRIGRVDAPLFCTLTYREPRATWEDTKRDLHTFIMRLERRDKEVCGVWRLEVQVRSVTHFHVLLWGAEFGSSLLDTVGPEKEWCAIWSQVVGDDSRAFLLHGARIELCRDMAAAFAYLSAHHTKRNQVADDYRGRIWGAFGRRYLRLDEPLDDWELTPRQEVAVRRILRRVASGRRWLGLAHRLKWQIPKVLSLPRCTIKRAVEYAKGQYPEPF